MYTDGEQEALTSPRMSLDHYAFPSPLLVGCLPFQTRTVWFRVDSLLLPDASTIG